MKTLVWLAGASAAAALGCAHTSNTNPHAMGAEEHEAAAEEEEQAASEHQTRYDPNAVGPRICDPGDGAACWSTSGNPTAEHADQAQRHRDLAAQHRAASQALRDAEARACAGIPEDDRDMSPFARRDDVRSVTALREDRVHQDVSMRHVVGAEVVFRAVPGMSASWLQRVVDCHIARNAAIGHDTASREMPYCPLTLHGVRATVRAVEDGFAVDVRSDDTDTAREIVRRAEALTQPPPSGPQAIDPRS